MAYIEIENIETWQEYIDLHENMDLSPYIFRGQSNAINDVGEFIKWDLGSSFNRVYTKSFSLQFAKLINQHLQEDLFKSYYGKYSYTGITDLSSLNALQKCYYLQHYGLPTCLIDFTFNPLIAMYFAMSGIQGTSGGSYDSDGKCINFSTEADRDYISIYRLNCNVLKEYFFVKDITNQNFDSYLSSYETPYYFNDVVNVKLGLILTPEKDLEGCSENHNLKMQKGCFLLFDNENGQDIGKKGRVDFIRFLKSHEQYKALQLPEPVVTIYNIKYNAFMWGKNRIVEDNKLNPKYISAFEFLRRKEVTGKTLFNDIQGLKYDFNFMYSIDR